MERPNIAELRALAADIMRTVIRTQLEKLKHAEELARKLCRKEKLEEHEIKLIEEEVKELKEAAKTIKAYAHRIPGRLLKMILGRFRRVRFFFKRLPVPETVKETLSKMLEEAIKEVESAGRLREKIKV